MSAQPIIAVLGLTASGKTELAVDLAEAYGGEVIGADSRQVYRRLEIATAKPTTEQRARVRHHLVDYVEPGTQYHLGRFLRDARAALADIQRRGARAVVAGGTGQYAWALLEGWSVPEVTPDSAFRDEMTALARREGAESLHARLAAVDPAGAARIDPQNTRRVIRALEVWHGTGRPASSWWDARETLPAVIVAPAYDLAELDARIAARVDAMFESGLVEEVEALLASGLPPDAPGLQSIGYRQVVAHLQGASTLDEAIEATKLATRQLARAQAKWFRRDDARIQWCTDPTEAAAAVAAGLQSAAENAR